MVGLNESNRCLTNQVVALVFRVVDDNLSEFADEWFADMFQLGEVVGMQPYFIGPWHLVLLIHMGIHRLHEPTADGDRTDAVCSKAGKHVPILRVEQ